jgi:transcriptional regulator with XRE-family HTH domain
MQPGSGFLFPLTQKCVKGFLWKPKYHIKCSLSSKKPILLFAMPRVSRLKLPPVDTGDQTIGQRLAQIRKQRGYSQRELAKKMGLIQTLISSYELDHLRLTAEMLIRFSKALDVGADEILGTASRNNHRQQMQFSLKIARRLKKIERLPPGQQKALLTNIDMFLKAAASGQATP